ncbi:MAG: hypothetical protein NWE98_03470 [Candidatus Bathyarchaeota archaeon]|nr:hypothetical protein [Candidatus Bathyarchaeota archaeon]
MNLEKRLTWREPAVFVAATALSTILAIWAVVTVPVESSPVPVVSGLYIAAAIYVPLALWFGIWGCLAGYFSCVFMGLYLNFIGVPGYSLDFVLIWSLADFFEGFVPLMIYRSLKMKPMLNLKRPTVTYGLNVLLALTVVISGVALISSMTTLFITTFVVAIVLLIAQAAVEDRRTWTIWLLVGVFLASIVSGIFGVGALAAFGNIPLSAFPTVFFGWVFGDILVLATIGTILTIVFTPYIMKSRLFVSGYITAEV